MSDPLSRRHETATKIGLWEPPHGHFDQRKVDQLVASMCDGETITWVGPALIVDGEAMRLLTGTHRQAAINTLRQLHGSALDRWAIPVVDWRSLVAEEVVVAYAETQGIDLAESVHRHLEASGAAMALGYDIEWD